MPSLPLLRVGKMFPGIGLVALCVCLWPKLAHADAADVVIYNFSGTAVCQTTGGCGPGIASGQSIAVTGAFQFDQDTESILSYSFSLPIAGAVSGGSAIFGAITTSGCLQSSVCSGPDSGFDVLIIIQNESETLANIPFVEMNLVFSDSPGEFGSLVVSSASPFTSNPSSFGVCDVAISTNAFSGPIGSCETGFTGTFAFISGEATSPQVPPPAPTPEPSSLLLLGTGLLGLGPLIRRAAVS